MFISCETEYIDTHQFRGDLLWLYSEGEKTSLQLAICDFRSGNYVFNDTITMDDEVLTANTGFTEASVEEVLFVRNFGNYEIKRCLYKSAFKVWVASYTHETYTRYLPFKFEAEEVWLNGERVAAPQIVFMKDTSTLVEIPLTEEEKERFFAHYQLTFPFKVFNKKDSTMTVISQMDYQYNVHRTTESVWDGIDNDDITIDVTYDWKPDQDQ
ncbi:MAG: hypothetical protein J6Y91_00110 [Alphaproteobacteria bacterium]|nr:hypothetical protein [Alphaproteobacteria bacterium]